MQTRVWLLMVVSFCAALVALALVYVSFTLAREVFALYAACDAPIEPRLEMNDNLQAVLVLWGIAGLLSWSCAFAARRIASAAPRGVRPTATALLVLSSLTLVGCAVSFVVYQLTCYGMLIG